MITFHNTRNLAFAELARLTVGFFALTFDPITETEFMGNAYRNQEALTKYDMYACFSLIRTLDKGGNKVWKLHYTDL